MQKAKLNIKNLLPLLVSVFSCFSLISAQEMPPAPSAPKSVSIPAVKETKLKNGLTVAVVERKNVPLVTAELVIMSGANRENDTKAGLANLTASMLTKGTKTRSATQIAEQTEFLGSAIDTGAGWNNSLVYVNSMTDKIDQSLAIMSDVVLNPTFKEEELDLLKTQSLDGLTYSLKQPSFLANYVAAKYSFGEHPAGGTPESLKSISTEDIRNFHSAWYQPANSVLIFTGDITQAQAVTLAEKYFGNWKNQGGAGWGSGRGSGYGRGNQKQVVKRILVVDLPNSGQASVNLAQRISGGRSGKNYYSASVLNSLLGGGYSSRLNQEIRIKRGLSYGANSNFGWRVGTTNFSARAQTKNESAAEVAELVVAEIKRLIETNADASDLNPRKAVLTGGFGRNLESNAGIAAQLADLYAFGIPTSELNAYMKNVEGISDAQIRQFAEGAFYNGDIVIVGDYAKFKDDLAKRFPNVGVKVIKASEVDLNKLN